MNILLDLKDAVVGAIRETGSQIEEFFPSIVGAIVVLIIGWIIASVAAKILKKVIGKIGLDKVADKLNTIDVMEKANIKLIPSFIIPKIVYFFLLFMFISIAAKTLNWDPLTNQIQGLLNYIPILLSAVLLLIIGLLIANFLKTIVIKACDSFGISSSRLIGGFVFIVVFVIIAISALSQAKIDTSLLNTNFTLIMGGIVLAFAVAYGIAARNILTNLLSSFYTKKRYRIGQSIKVNDISGEIVDLDNTSITLKDHDKKVVIPMQTLINENVEIYD